MNGADDNITFDLCSDDRRLLDQLIDVEFDADALEPLNEADRRRVHQIIRMFGLLNDYPVADADHSLVDVTMARIDQHDRNIASSMTLHRAGADQPNPGRIAAASRNDAAATGVLASLSHWRLPDFLTIAASLLVVASVCLPMLRPGEPDANSFTGAGGETIPSRSNAELFRIFDVSEFFQSNDAAAPNAGTSGAAGDQWMIWSPGRVSVVTASRAEISEMLADDEFALPITAVVVYRDAQNQPRARGVIRHDELPVQFGEDDWKRWRFSPSPIDLPTSPLLDRPAMDPFPLYAP